ncbi:N-ATPase subunit AtpR [Oceanicella actignis]|uniref:N-ATPase, AtpR subunit n=1 Tax=Oceanicella actignis TaxID=1189325 RepID=A0A1M7S914_9RHOB|nr:ATP synthase subunit I [Oceanicella actignis]TYO91606.1 F1-F0 ATPase (N-ATPase) AtpR subunit [Oceanicella actignis]SET31070.1 N-ATPase, AtpR subunit [Oceanicella actignis]SHN55067.1 N-ATPase, AtpR subunit [Oceanicella actignis]
MTPPTLAPALEAAAFAAAGAALGMVYLALLRRATPAAGAAGPMRAAALALGRLTLAGAAFWLAAQRGAGPLLALFAGFLLARRLRMRAALRELDAGPRPPAHRGADPGARDAPQDGKRP